MNPASKHALAAWIDRGRRYAWRRFALRNLSGADNYRQLDRLYAVPDPWNLNADREQARFASTNALIRERVGRVDRLLEVGCGEGHQTVHLQQVAHRVTALDVSLRAIERTRRRTPDARLLVGSLDALLPAGSPPFDLVVAAEVFYYVKDVSGLLAGMNALGSACLVTCFAPAGPVLAPHLGGLRELERGWFAHGGVVWLYAVWFPAGRRPAPVR